MQYQMKTRQEVEAAQTFDGDTADNFGDEDDIDEGT